MSASDSSSLSSLSSAPSTDDELTDAPSIVPKKGTPNGNASPYAKLRITPTRPKRPASPPHEYVLADNPDIAFIVMFRSRFSDTIPKNVPHFGPQDVEQGVVGSVPGEPVEHFLCALLGLVLNRKKYVERAHYGRALEEAIQTQKSQWPVTWNGVNPLSGGKSFQTMSPTEKLSLLRALILWSLNTSEAVTNIIKESYKQSRHNDDLNQPLSVQPWGRDMDKRRYWLIEGQDDTHFRLYRESNPMLKHNTWWSVAGTIDELKAVAAKLTEEGSQAGKRLSDRILAAIPRLEATEEKRRRKEYRQSRKAQLVRPDPGFSLYEGRTRGKRMRYTFSDEEDEISDARSTRRSARSTPAEQRGPTITASGRQVKPRFGGAHSGAPLSGQDASQASPATGEYERSDASDEPRGVRTRLRGGSNLRHELNSQPKRASRIDDSDSVDEMGDEQDATSSGGEWQGEDGDEDGPNSPSDDTEEDEEGDGFDRRPRKSLMVTLHYGRKGTDAGTDAGTRLALNGDGELQNCSRPSIAAAAQHPSNVKPVISASPLPPPSSHLEPKALQETIKIKPLLVGEPSIISQQPSSTDSAPLHGQSPASLRAHPQMPSKYLPNGYQQAGADAQPLERCLPPSTPPLNPAIAPLQTNV